ncbi:hypothetical protein M0812_20168 [Anaeramoeba flamelloides]|uniref:GTP-binding protein n=1 Tax=Anaeramoeba flamelloides TaxID=1746091 RepID=A0AAV7YZI0_9EUKA|nr:hypothetical protein M0812_20168 [Anaeramoeba flamelloides]
MNLDDLTFQETIGNLYGESEIQNYDLEGEEELAEDLPKILILGNKQCGKSSIQKVLFQRMHPQETPTLESTRKITRQTIQTSPFVNFQVMEAPETIDFFETEFDLLEEFKNSNSIIYVVDVSQDLTTEIESLLKIINKSHQENKNLFYEIFLHKTDTLKDEEKEELKLKINKELKEQLQSQFEEKDNGNELEKENEKEKENENENEKEQEIKFQLYLTSIYDPSIFAAFSRVVQKLIKENKVLISLLDLLKNSCKIDRAFLFDIYSKIYIASDTAKFDLTSYEICSDTIDLVSDFSELYGYEAKNSNNKKKNKSKSKSKNEKKKKSKKKKKKNIDLDLDSDELEINNSNQTEEQPPEGIVTLESGQTIYVLQVINGVALVCIFDNEVMKKKGIVFYNCKCFASSVKNVLTFDHQNVSKQFQKQIKKAF